MYYEKKGPEDGAGGFLELGPDSGGGDGGPGLVARQRPHKERGLKFDDCRERWQ